ncbi:MAG: O-antigen ligase family protein [Gemmatimonadota bacterium]|jgi:hypothetical protein
MDPVIDEPPNPAAESEAEEPAPPEPCAPSAGARFFSLLIALAALGVVLLSVPSPLFDLDRHSVPKELVMHITALLALPWLFGGRRPRRPGVIEVLLGTFVAWSALSTIFATNHWIALRAFGVGTSAFLVFLCARRVAAEGGGSVALRGLALAAIAGAAIGLAQAYGARIEWIAGDRPPGGTFGNRNFLAHFTAISTPLLLLLATRSRRAAGRAVWLLGLAIAACAIVLTRSRAGWLGFGGGLAVMGTTWLLTRPETRAATSPPVRLAAVALAIGVLFALVVPNRLAWRSSSPYADTLTRLTDYRSGSGHGRLVQYRNSLRLVGDRPILGVGPGNWFVRYPRVTTRNDPAFDADDPIPTNPWPSSDWVALLVERGAIAVLLALAAGAAATLVSLRRIRSTDTSAGLAAATVPAILVASLVTGAFDAVLMLAPPAFFVAAAVGLLLPATRPVARPRLEGRRRLFGGFVLTAVMLAVLLVDAAQLTAIRITRDSTRRATVERALRFDPGNYRLHLLLAERGPCAQRVPHARAAARLLPWHPAPREALRACGAR